MYVLHCYVHAVNVTFSKLHVLIDVGRLGRVQLVRGVDYG